MTQKKYLTIILLIAVVILIGDNVRLRIVNSKIYSNSLNKDSLLRIKDGHIDKAKSDCLTEVGELKLKIQEISPRYESVISELKHQGLKDPINDIRNDLMKNQNLIPKRNVPTGILYFRRDNISIINSKWVLAYYDDGHFDGELLARFTVDKSGRISWKVIADER